LTALFSKRTFLLWLDLKPQRKIEVNRWASVHEWFDGNQSRTYVRTWRPFWIFGGAGFRYEPFPSEAQPTNKMSGQSANPSFH
jgi:hypothetical protein